MKKFILFLFLPLFSQSQTWEELNAKLDEYSNKGDYVNALIYSEKLVEKAEKDFGKADFKYLEAINNLGTMYIYTGDYVKAEPLLYEAIGILKKDSKENTSDYASALNNLGRLYQETGNYPKAEPLYIEALALKKKTLGDSTMEYASTMNDLALLYDALGDYQKAEPMLQQLTVTLKIILGEDDPIYGQSLNNLATLYYNIEKYDEAEKLYLKALEIKKKQGESHPDYVMSINNLAVVYKKKKDFVKSESFFKQSLELRKKSPGMRSNSYADALNNLGTLYDDMKKYDEAERLFLEALKIQGEITSVNHNKYATFSNNLAKVYEKKGFLEKAEPWYFAAVNGSNYKIKEQFSFLSEKEKGYFLKTVSSRFDDFNSFALNRKASNPEITASVYNNLLKTKGILLRSAAAMRNAIMEKNDSLLSKKYDDWTELKEKINSVSAIPIDKRTEDLSVLEKQANDLERELVKSSAAMSEMETFTNITWETVKAKLKKNEAAVEFTSFKRGKDSTLYCALLIKKDSKYPIMLPVFEEKELIALLEKKHGSEVNYINAIYGTKNAPNTEAYNLIWKPLEMNLKGIKKVYVSPNGLLHKVSFASLSKQTGSYLINSINICNLTSTAFVGNNAVIDITANSKVSVFGGISYSSNPKENTPWEYLPGTKTEVTQIQKLLIEKGIKSKVISDSAATELRFKQESENSSIIHIATHGFFFPDPEELKKQKVNKTETKESIAFRGSKGSAGIVIYNKDPLARSGLALAGADDSWNYESKSEDNNGILSAAELALFDLRKNKLVVLSACETGLGDIKSGEGVYGLQRSFKLAGSSFIIMSLWQVPDEETAQFMKQFYSKLIATKNIRTAFNETQLTMSKNLDPYYWAAFVLTE